MFLAVKENGKNYVGVSNRRNVAEMNVKDMLLDENLTMWKILGHKGWYAVCDRFNPSVDVLRYAKELFEDEITYQSLLRHTIPKMKEYLNKRGLIKDRYWYNDILIVGKDKAYTIDGYFGIQEVVGVEVSDVRSEIARGSLEFNKNLPAKERICEALHSVEESHADRCFPAIFLDVATGKKETWWSYEDALAKIRKTRSCEVDAKL